MKSSYVKKSMVFAIILLFIGVSVLSSVSSKDISVSDDTNNELIEIKVEMCRIGGREEYTVWLTQEESDALDVLIEDFKEKLDKSESLKETKELHCDMIISLYELGIYPDDIDISNRNTILSDVYGYGAIVPVINNFLDIVNFRHLFPNMMNGNVNFFCYLSGEMVHTIPRKFFGSIGIGMVAIDLETHDFRYYPAKGWLLTNGLLGYVRWNDEFWGGFYLPIYLPMREIGGRYFEIDYARGVIGFWGTKIEIGFEHYYYQGFAYVVKISLDYPWP
jgi:hypothetical protein